MITVVNKHHGATGVNVMRPTVLGNPFVVGRDGDRAACVAQYRQWLWQQMQHEGPVLTELKRLAALHKAGVTINLVCCCAPLACHADVIKAAIEWLAQQEEP